MGKSLTFQEVLSLTSCPYCHAAKGQPCAKMSANSQSRVPHKSRQIRAFDISDSAALAQSAEWRDLIKPLILKMHAEGYATLIINRDGGDVRLSVE
jgi:hypothetical protein